MLQISGCKSCPNGVETTVPTDVHSTRKVLEGLLKTYQDQSDLYHKLSYSLSGHAAADHMARHQAFEYAVMKVREQLRSVPGGVTEAPLDVIPENHPAHRNQLLP